MCGFNGALQDVQGHSTIAPEGEAGRQVLIPNVLYVPGVRANLLSASQLKENGVKLQEDDDEMLLVSAAGDVLGQASYTGRVLCTDLRPCSAKSTTTHDGGRGPAGDRLVGVWRRLAVCRVRRREASAAHLPRPGLRRRRRAARRARRPVRAIPSGCQGWQPVLLAAEGPQDPLRVGEAGRQEVGCAAGVRAVAGGD
ncbi:unnamed protein product [Closterium sp. NIES-54]